VTIATSATKAAADVWFTFPPSVPRGPVRPSLLLCSFHAPARFERKGCAIILGVPYSRYPA
jgi:hypothetical protein